MTKEQIKDKIQSEVTYDVIFQPEDMSVRGNCMASGDDELDARVESEIIEKLEGGNQWAWCVVEVKASWKEFSESDYLGGCSYESEKDFCEGDGYFHDMKETALDNLCGYLAQLKDLFDSI